MFYVLDDSLLLSIFSGLLNFIIGHRNMNVGKIDNLIVQDFKDVFTSSDLNTVFKHKYLF